MLGSQMIKSQFPILSRRVNDKPLVYLDNAATSQKPQVVIDAISNYYTQHNSNVHRGVHRLSDESTRVFEESRNSIASFFGAESEELIVTRNATEAINGVAYGWAAQNLQAGDVIVTSLMEHHANFVVWQEVAKRTGAKLEFVGVDDQGRLKLDELRQKLETSPVKLVALVHVSNTTGTVNPIKKIKKIIANNQKETPIRLLLDGAQSAPHMPINFKQLDVDFYVFSGHKMLAPMGVGGLLVKKELLESGEMKPWLFGGGMIFSVLPEATEYNPDLVERFTAGTPDVASIVGLAAACEYLKTLEMRKVEQHDRELVLYAIEKLSRIPEVKIIGPVTPAQAGQSLDRLGSVAFIHQTAHAHDVSQILDSEGVAVRSGHHCTMPLHTHFGWQATTRASFSVYSSKTDVDALVKGLEKISQVFK
ncbi:MAG: SufS family cysteine desulfurase [Candidatus Pacebacteria bacterium]|jgi:cysteine desulfurase / selenocysteine lyase|nr:SufS family cysteine desulfurase [Candidatus Paceibacterota bacterium]MBT3511497.1 SufS family cysteine desulfurase [Candidatus Paceibacterota bacterium]MBT4004651.1 SufS family cysteine desulfurase [Candidatus Paceibacterota bacterium]MBT4358431.1 SufS family cysteine desulfurase [Candidatus Paceibacterota bacterium]MBT4681051.1 SufS family cysteine desulfurase [Candidatus Paceibacterota bacterium]